MNNLPQELINRIVWYAERYPGQGKWYPAAGQSFRHEGPSSQFPRLATLNHCWKEAVETITFHRLAIRSNDQAIVTGNRRTHLTKIEFTPLLPEYSDDACARVESREERRLNDEAFTQGILDFFAVLKAWEDEGIRNALQVELKSAASPTDERIGGPNSEQLQMDIATRKRKDIQWKRWENSQLHFLRIDLLPVLSNVKHFKVEIYSSSRRLDIYIAPSLARSMPNLENIDWVIMDDELEFVDESSDDDSFGYDDEESSDEETEAITSLSKYAHMRCEKRMTFTKELGKMHILSRSSAELSFFHDSPSDQRHTYPSIVPAEFTYDLFSTALRNFSQNLSALTLSAYVDSTLFWPSRDEEDAIIPSWPHLRSLDITFDMLSPFGDWYFTGTRSIDDSDTGTHYGSGGRKSIYCHYRVHPDPQTFDPFLAALAKAVAKMPRLEYFMLTSELQGETGRLHISYCAPGKVSECASESESPEDLACRRIYYACEVGKNWFPKPETAQSLRAAGTELFGGEVIERYVGSLYYSH